MSLFESMFNATRTEEVLGRFFHAVPFLGAQASWVAIVSFFFIAYAFTWNLHGLIIRYRLPFRQSSKSYAQVLYFVGLCGPLVAALLSAFMFYGQAGIIGLLSGSLICNVSWAWYVLAIAPIGIIYSLSVFLYGLWQKNRVTLFKMPPKSVLVLTLSQVWVVVAEEFGWRGFALPHLQGLFGWLLGTLVLGILWALWHLPMFLAPGSNQYGSSFPKYVYALTVWSFFMAMLYYQTNGSVLICMIFHAAANLWGLTLNVSEKAERIAMLLYLPVLFVALALLPWWV
jgi:hypothetical protein